MGFFFQIWVSLLFYSHFHTAVSKLFWRRTSSNQVTHTHRYEGTPNGQSSLPHIVEQSKLPAASPDKQLVSPYLETVRLPGPHDFKQWE